MLFLCGGNKESSPMFEKKEDLKTCNVGEVQKTSHCDNPRRP